VKKFFRYCAIFFVLAAPSAFLTGLQVTRSFGDDVWRLSAIEVCFSVGMIAGGIIITSWGGFKNRTHTMILSSLIFGVCAFALGSIPVFWIYLAFMLLCGVSMPFFNTPSTVLLQEKVEPDYLGRVFGVLGMISSALMPLGMLVFGPVSDFVKIEWLLMGTGVLLIIQGLVLIGDRVLIEAGRPTIKAEPGEEPEPKP